VTLKSGKLKANKPIGTGPDEREHGTRWATGVRGLINADIVRQFASIGMSMPAIGYLCGCTKQNIYTTIIKDEELNQAWCEGISLLIAKAGSSLDRKLDSDDSLMTLFTLKCSHLPGEKGWIEEQYVKDSVNPNTAPIVNVYLPDNNRDNTFYGKDGNES